MKKKILLALTFLFYTPLLTAQILYNETFENFTVGNLGTDPTGVIPGQYRW